MANPYTLNSASTASATSFNCNGNASMAAGDVLVANVWTANTATSVTDSQGNSWVLASKPKGGASQWVTAGKTVALAAIDTITVKQSVAGAGNVVVIGVPGAIYAPIDQSGGNTGTGTSTSVSTGSLITSDGQTAIAMVASAASLPTWTGKFNALGTSHGTSTEFVGTAYLAGITASVSAKSTVTSGAYATLVVTLQMTSFVNAPPVPPTQHAGQLAASADMNALANTALFLRRPPMVVAQSNTSGTGQAMTVASAGVTYSTVQRDTDGMFAQANPSRLTVQTPGFYQVRYCVPFTVTATNCQVWARITTGANNPLGSGIQSSWWYGYCAAANGVQGVVNGGGIIPLYMYQADYIQIMAGVGVADNMPVTPIPAITSMRLVSL